MLLCSIGYLSEALLWRNFAAIAMYELFGPSQHIMAIYISVVIAPRSRMADLFAQATMVFSTE
jgi:hypothetical protein